MLKLRVLTIESVAVDQEVEELTVQTANGVTGILPSHSALLTKLEPGVFRFRAKGQEVRMVGSSGSLEVIGDKVTILIDEVLPIGEIDVERARAERESLLNVLERRDMNVYELQDARKKLKNVNAKISAVE